MEIETPPDLPEGEEVLSEIFMFRRSWAGLGEMVMWPLLVVVVDIPAVHGFTVIA